MFLLEALFIFDSVWRANSFPSIDIESISNTVDALVNNGPVSTIVIPDPVPEPATSKRYVKL